MWKIILICVIFPFIQCQSRSCSMYDTLFSSYVSKPFPLLENGTALVTSNADFGRFEIQDGKSIDMSCVGNHLEFYGVGYKDKETATMTCRNGTLFSEDWIPEQALALRWLTCAEPATSAEEHTTKRCGENDKGRIVEVYVDSKLNDKHYLYETCFDDSIKQPLYVKHVLNEKSKRSFITNFTKIYKGSSLAYSGLNLDKIFDFGSQRDVVWDIIGSNTGQYVNYDNQLEIGNLNSLWNYEFDSIQRATINYINVIPMWTKIRSGSWSESSPGMIDFVNKDDITIYSGAWGVNTLKDEKGIEQEIWLEGKGSERYPSPLWLYRVAYEVSTKKGIAFLILNNPYITRAEAENLAQVFPCTDPCPNMSWITSATVSRGYVTCCAIDDFRKVVKDLPSFETEGLLMP